MNVVTEQDLDLLDEYLDGALAPDEVERVRNRLADEPALAAALDELRGQRDMRAAAWSTLAPTEADAQAFATKVISHVHRQDRWWRINRYARYGSAAAACLLVGFFAGWLGRDGGTGGPLPTGGPAPTIQVSNHPTLGVYISEVRVRQERGGAEIPMLLVRQVIPGSAAAGAGLREGDLLLSVDDQTVRDVGTLSAALSGRRGSRVLRVLRNGEIGTITIQPR